MKLHEGVQAVRPTGEFNAPKLEMSFGAAVMLAPFTGQYQFFTPALLYLHGRFHDAPLIDFTEESKIDPIYLHKRFQNRIFSGMDCGSDPAWNYVLWAIPRYHWPAFEAFMLSLALYCPETENVYRVGSQDLSIVDPLAADKKLLAPRLDIVVFGVNGNRECVAVTRPKSGVVIGGLPRVRRYPPQARTTAFASALFAKEDPVAAVAALGPEVRLPDDSMPPFRTVPLDQMSPDKRMEYEALLRQYHKTM